MYPIKWSCYSNRNADFLIYYFNKLFILAKRFIKWYGWKPDLPDPNDFKYKISKPDIELTSVDLVKEFDLHKSSPCYNQGNLGSCTGNGVGFLIQFNLLKQEAFMPARLFIYYNERIIEGSVNYDSGAAIRDGIKVVNKLGVPDEKYVPYIIQDFRKRPSVEAFKAALQNKAVMYQRLDNTNKHQLVDCLKQGFPFVFGFTVFTSFESQEVAKTGVLNLPANSEQVLGGHCVVCVGYNADSDRFIIRNSWGTDWGQEGYFTMPAAFMTNPQLVSDVWMITKVAPYT